VEIDSNKVVKRLQIELDWHMNNSYWQKNKIPCQCEYHPGYYCEYCKVHHYLYGEWPSDQWKDTYEDEEDI